MARALRLWVRIDKREGEKIRAEAKKRGLSVSEYIRVMCGHPL